MPFLLDKQQGGEGGDYTGGPFILIFDDSWDSSGKKKKVIKRTLEDKVSNSSGTRIFNPPCSYDQGRKEIEFSFVKIF